MLGALIALLAQAGSCELPASQRLGSPARLQLSDGSFFALARSTTMASGRLEPSGHAALTLETHGVHVDAHADLAVYASTYVDFGDGFISGLGTPFRVDFVTADHADIVPVGLKAVTRLGAWSPRRVSCSKLRFVGEVNADPRVEKTVQLVDGAELRPAPDRAPAFRFPQPTDAQLLESQGDLRRVRVDLEDGATLTGWVRAAEVSRVRVYASEGRAFSVSVGTFASKLGLQPDPHEGPAVRLSEKMHCPQRLSLHVRSGNRTERVGEIDSGTSFFSAADGAWAILFLPTANFTLLSGWRWAVPLSELKACGPPPPVAECELAKDAWTRRTSELELDDGTQFARLSPLGPGAVSGRLVDGKAELVLISSGFHLRARASLVMFPREQVPFGAGFVAGTETPLRLVGLSGSTVRVVPDRSPSFTPRAEWAPSLVGCEDLSSDVSAPADAPGGEVKLKAAAGTGVQLDPTGPADFTLDAAAPVEVFEAAGALRHVRAWVGGGSTLTGWVPAASLSAGPIGGQTVIPPRMPGAHHRSGPRSPLVCLHALPVAVRHGDRVTELGSLDAGWAFDLVTDGEWTVIDPRDGPDLELLEGWQWVVPTRELRDCERRL